MNKLTLLLIIFITSSILSCSSDDSIAPIISPTINQQNSSEIIINGTNYSTVNGYLTRQTNGGTGYKNLIILSDGEVLSNPYDADTIDANSYSNDTNNLVVLTVNSTSINELAEGTYNLDTTDFAGSGNLYWTTVITGITLNNNLIDNYAYESFSSSNSSNTVTSGSINISKNMNVYTISYTLNLANSSITGSYTGELIELQYTE